MGVSSLGKTTVSDGVLALLLAVLFALLESIIKPASSWSSLSSGSRRTSSSVSSIMPIVFECAGVPLARIDSAAAASSTRKRSIAPIKAAAAAARASLGVPSTRARIQRSRSNSGGSSGGGDDGMAFECHTLLDAPNARRSKLVPGSSNLFLNSNESGSVQAQAIHGVAAARVEEYRHLRRLTSSEARTCTGGVFTSAIDMPFVRARAGAPAPKMAARCGQKARAPPFIAIKNLHTHSAVEHVRAAALNKGLTRRQSADALPASSALQRAQALPKLPAAEPAAMPPAQLVQITLLSTASASSLANIGQPNKLASKSKKSKKPQQQHSRQSVVSASCLERHNLSQASSLSSLSLNSFIDSHATKQLAETRAHSTKLDSFICEKANVQNLSFKNRELNEQDSSQSLNQNRFITSVR